MDGASAILHATSRGVAALLTAPSFAEGMSRALQLVGEALQVDRVLVVEHPQPPDPARPVILSYVWQTPDAPVSIDASFFSGPPFTDPGFAAWIAPLPQDKPIIDLVGTARGAGATLLGALKSKSILIVPVRIEGRVWGGLGIDTRKSERVWLQDEIDGLRTLAQVIGSLIMRERNVSGLANRDAILHGISRSVAALLTSPTFAEGMSKALQIVGETLGVDRIFVLEKIDPSDPAGQVALCYGWQVPDVPVVIDPAVFSSLVSQSPELTARWDAAMAENRVVIESIRTAAGPVAIMFEMTKIKSFLMVPIRADGKQWGSLTIDVCKSERDWSPAEIEALRTLAQVIGASIMRERYTNELADANKIVNSTPTMLFRIKGTPEFPMSYIGGNVSWFGYSVAELLSAPNLYVALIHPDDRAKIAEILRGLLAPNAPAGTIEYRYRKGDLYCWVEVRFTPIRNDDGSLKEVEGVVVDISERKQAEAQILRMARDDALTGLPNRYVFSEALTQEIARTRRGEKGFAILYLDLDHFKDVNDTLGHSIGDLLLKAVGNRLRASLRETDTVARFGGDEFAVLQTALDDPANAGTLATKLLEVLGKSYLIDGNVIHIGTSIGIAIYGPEDPDAEALLSHADEALYRAKSEGRGTYRFFTEAMDVVVHQRVALASDLREAIATQQLFLLYQPQIEIATGRIIGLEALVRWQHPRLGLLPPPEFIEAAERNGLIGALGQFVLEAACRQIKKWVDAGVAPATNAVNISSIQFKAPLELESKILAILEEVSLPPHYLELELTETAIMEVSSDNNDVLQRLQKRGIKLAIDDFGTGYSSLSYLRRFPVDLIKIAQHFVKDVLTDPGAAAIVKATIGLARELKLDVIAEGVETVEQLNLLNSWGCRAVQGFYYARPMPPEQIELLLRQGTIHVDRREPAFQHQTGLPLKIITTD